MRAGIVDDMFLTTPGFFSKIDRHDVFAWQRRTGIPPMYATVYRLRCD
jgi:hypothetical protein